MGRESLGVENLVLSGTNFLGATTAPGDLPICPPEAGASGEHACSGRGQCWGEGMCSLLIGKGAPPFG